MLLGTRALSFCLLLPIAAGAQATRYARSTSDTVRLHEVTTSQLSLTTPGGAMSVETEHDAVIAMTALGGDTISAWYDALQIAATTPTGRLAPETADALRQPFTLRLSPHGKVTVVRTPVFPTSFQGVTDLTHQFDDFFLPLPPTPLAVGVTWRDSTARVDSGAEGGRWFRSRRVGQYRVARDTVIDGRRALVVAVEQESRLDVGGPLPGQPMTAVSAMAGRDSGVFEFDASAGRMLGRRRTGELRGTLTMHPAGGSPVTFPQTLRYTHSIEPARR